MFGSSSHEIVLDIQYGDRMLQDVVFEVNVDIDAREEYGWCSSITHRSPVSGDVSINHNHPLYKEIKSACEKWVDDNFEWLYDDYKSHCSEYLYNERNGD